VVLAWELAGALDWEPVEMLLAEAPDWESVEVLYAEVLYAEVLAWELAGVLDWDLVEVLLSVVLVGYCKHPQLSSSL
jgi:hypothetical protein